MREVPGRIMSDGTDPTVTDVSASRHQHEQPDADGNESMASVPDPENESKPAQRMRNTGTTKVFDPDRVDISCFSTGSGGSTIDVVQNMVSKVVTDAANVIKLFFFVLIVKDKRNVHG